MATVTDRQLKSIPGWFGPSDWGLFRFSLDESTRQMGTGDLAELGAYLGKSAVLIGEYVKPGETFTVLDLFGASAETAGNAAENEEQYPELTRARFEENYLRVHDELPSVVQAPSSQVLQHATHNTHRFIHVDASHLYDQVVQDVRASQLLLQPQGMVVFDDYRMFHAAGVSAAVWEALRDGLNPIAMTRKKLYATWGDPKPWVASLEAWISTSKLDHIVESIAGRAVYRTWIRPNRIVGVLQELDRRRRSGAR